MWLHIHHWCDMTGNEKLVLLWSSYIWKINTLNETNQARFSRPDPRRDSCMLCISNTSGSSEMCAEQQYVTWQAGELSHTANLLVLNIFKLSSFKGGAHMRACLIWTTYRVAKWNATTVRLYKGVHELKKLCWGIRLTLLSAVHPQSAMKPVNTGSAALPENKSAFKIKTSRSADKDVWLQTLY